VRAEQLEDLLAEVAAGRLAPAAAVERLRHLPFEDLGFARIDHHRALRQGHPEVVFCEGKTGEQVVAICTRLAAMAGTFLGTRCTPAQAALVAAAFPTVRHNPLARTIHLPVDGAPTPGPDAGTILVISAGDQLREADVVIVVAGMEGALPSVVGGLVKAPVIAVPTSVGYGAAFGGLAALLGMLNSCAAGVTVVNIDNGFGAAAAASRICVP